MIPLMRNAFVREHETIDALIDWLATYPARLSMDEQCAAFERAFAAWQGRDHAVLFNSGGSANLALLQALRNSGLKAGSCIGFSALTWATNVMPITQMGYIPVPIDVDPCTLNVMSYILAKHLLAIDALFITNALGYLPDLDNIRSMCDDYGIVLIEDNCESLGSELPNGKAGNFGKAATFSFFVAHHMSTIEGGMVCTDDDDLAEMLRMVRAKCWDRNLAAGQKDKWRRRFGVDSEFEAKYTFYVNAFNMRPTEITGFLGLQQLHYLDESLCARARIFNDLENAVRENDDLLLLDRTYMTKLSPFAFVVLCKTPQLRDEYVKRFGGAGVEIRPVIAGNIVKQPFYRDYDKPPLPGAERVDQCGFYFGIYPELTSSDLETLKSCLAGW
jgi:CDP-4-dehydro-6-deoxyglucose reductase, E1